MFGLSNTPKPIENYQQAKRRFESIKPIRGHDENGPRPAGSRRNQALTIRPVDHRGVAGYAIRYHRTDVITFLEDDRILLEVYPSMSTNRLVNDVLAYNSIVSYWQDTAIRACFTKIGLGSDERYYMTPSYVEFRGNEMLSGFVPIETPRVDRKAANAAYKEFHVNDFVTWIKTLDRLNQLHEHLTQRHLGQISSGKVADLLEARDFPAVAAMCCARYYNGDYEKMSTVIDRVRLHVVLATGALTFQTRDYVESYGEVRAHISAVRKFDL